MIEIKQFVLQINQFKRHYNFQIVTPGITLLKGRSGCGKTSLLHAITGFHQGLSGDIYWKNQSLADVAVENRPVALMFQQHNFFEHISILENIKLAVNINEQQIHENAKKLGIETQLHKLPGQLSGGQRKRAALLKTLLRPEPIILLDEPFAQLDKHNRQQCRQWLQTYSNTYDKTVILVSHDEQDNKIADQVINLDL